MLPFRPVSIPQLSSTSFSRDQTMAIYLMLDTELHDADVYKEYIAAAPEYLERHGGDYLCRGDPVDVLSEIGVQIGLLC